MTHHGPCTHATCHVTHHGPCTSCPVLSPILLLPACYCLPAMSPPVPPSCYCLPADPVTASALMRLGAGAAIAAAARTRLRADLLPLHRHELERLTVRAEGGARADVEGGLGWGGAGL